MNMPLRPHPGDNICLCCGNEKPQFDFIRNTSVCTLCSMLPVIDAINSTHATDEKRHKYVTETAAGRREARRAAKMAVLEQHGKRCGSCWHYKPVAAYAVCNHLSDGLQQNCKACTRLRLDTLNAGGSKTQWHAIQAALRSIAPPKRTA